MVAEGESLESWSTFVSDVMGVTFYLLFHLDAITGEGVKYYREVDKRPKIEWMTMV